MKGHDRNGIIQSEKACEMYWLLGVLYLVLMVTLGVLSIRKGHWVMFIIGIFIPLFWFIGALMPPRRRLA